MIMWKKLLALALSLTLLAGCEPAELLGGSASSAPGTAQSTQLPEPEPEPEPVSEPEPERTRTLPGWTLLAGMVGAVALAEGMILYGRRRKR